MTDTGVRVSQSLYCFTTSISHGVEKYFPRLWGIGISDTNFFSNTVLLLLQIVFWPQNLSVYNN